MEAFGNALKAVIIVFGGLALIGLLFLLGPVLEVVLAVLLPVILIVAAIMLVYHLLSSGNR